MSVLLSGMKVAKEMLNDAHCDEDVLVARQFLFSMVSDQIRQRLAELPSPFQNKGANGHGN